MKNKLHYPFLLCLTIVGSLLLLSVIPPFSTGNSVFRKIDLLSDVRIPSADSVQSTETHTPIADSIVVEQDSIVEIVHEHCPGGLICIEDYSQDSTALKHFLDALIKTKETKSPLRIAFYGDSFIEGDVFCGSFRDTLQSVFGGRGVGYVPITSDVAGFRNTIKHRFENWIQSTLISKKDSLARIGPSGYCFTPLEGNWVEYTPSRQRYLREFNTIKLYYRNAGNAVLHYQVDTLQSSEPLVASGHIREWRYAGNKVSRVRFEFDPYDGLWLYGASFENDQGICVDNFSLRGNSGMNLVSISPELYRDFNQYRNYKLIILQFGLNLIMEEHLDYGAYAKRMVFVVNKLRQLFPETSFLLLSVSDRSSNIDGEFKTMPAIPAMRDAQRLIAQETKIAFWDMYEAMGGENSIVKFVEADPPLAAKDYTHLNFRGGKKVSGSLVKSLLFELKKYEKRKSGKKKKK